jgi:hypothetical protein
LSRVEALGPDIRIGFGVDQLAIDAGSIAPSSHTAAEHIADNLTAAGNSATLSHFTGKPTGTIYTYSGVTVDDGNNTGVSIVGGRSGTAGAWDAAAATQKCGYAFGATTDYCELFSTTASGPTGLARNATAGLLNDSTGTPQSDQSSYWRAGFHPSMQISGGSRVHNWPAAKFSTREQNLGARR